MHIVVHNGAIYFDQSTNRVNQWLLDEGLTGNT